MSDRSFFFFFNIYPLHVTQRNVRTLSKSTVRSAYYVILYIRKYVHAVSDISRIIIYILTVGSDNIRFFFFIHKCINLIRAIISRIDKIINQYIFYVNITY